MLHKEKQAEGLFLFHLGSFMLKTQITFFKTQISTVIAVQAV